MYKVKEGIVGFAVGDAMGVPTEFCSREKLLDKPITKMVSRIRDGLPKGAWSDDTSLTLATMASMIDYGLNYNEIANNYVKWFTNNEFCSVDTAFGIGRTTLKSLVKYTQTEEDAYLCGESSFYDNGNGSLMRMVPIAYYLNSKRYNNKEIYNIIKKYSSITHGHEIAVCGCYIYTKYMILLMQGKNKLDAIKEIQKIDYSMFNKKTLEAYNRVLRGDLINLTIDDIKSSGYVVDTLESVLWCFLNAKSYHQSIIATTNIGDDTDTIGALTGALSGIYYGYNSIPEEWVNNLRKKDYIMDLCDKFDDFLKK